MCLVFVGIFLMMQLFISCQIVKPIVKYLNILQQSEFPEHEYEEHLEETARLQYQVQEQK